MEKWRTAPLEGLVEMTVDVGGRFGSHGRGVMKDIADNIENDRGVLVDLYIPRHCSATS